MSGRIPRQEVHARTAFAEKERKGDAFISPSFPSLFPSHYSPSPHHRRREGDKRVPLCSFCGRHARCCCNTLIPITSITLASLPRPVGRSVVVGRSRSIGCCKCNAMIASSCLLLLPRSLRAFPRASKVSAAAFQCSNPQGSNAEFVFPTQLYPLSSRYITQRSWG